MELNNNSSDLDGWTIGAKNNPLGWFQNGNQYGLVASDPIRFIDMSGSHDRDPFPVLVQDVTLQPGSYQLEFDLGQDAAHKFPGPVSVDVNTTGVIASQGTFSTVGSGGNWQTFTEKIDVSNNGTMRLSFKAHAGQNKGFIGLDNVSLKAFMPVGKCL